MFLYHFQVVKFQIDLRGGLLYNNMTFFRHMQDSFLLLISVLNSADASKLENTA